MANSVSNSLCLGRGFWHAKAKANLVLLLNEIGYSIACDVRVSISNAPLELASASTRMLDTAFF